MWHGNIYIHLQQNPPDQPYKGHEFCKMSFLRNLSSLGFSTWNRSRSGCYCIRLYCENTSSENCLSFRCSNPWSLKKDPFVPRLTNNWVLRLPGRWLISRWSKCCRRSGLWNFRNHSTIWCHRNRKITWYFSQLAANLIQSCQILAMQHDAFIAGLCRSPWQRWVTSWWLPRYTRAVIKSWVYSFTTWLYSYTQPTSVMEWYKYIYCIYCIYCTL